MYVAAASLLLLLAGRAFTDERGRVKAFGVMEGQSPVALSVALPAVAVATFVVAALLDLVAV